MPTSARAGSDISAKARKDPSVFPLAIVVGSIALVAGYMLLSKSSKQGGGSEARGKPEASPRSHPEGVPVRKSASAAFLPSTGRGPALPVSSTSSGKLGMPSLPLTTLFGRGLIR